MHFGSKIYYVYIITNRCKTLYTGVTNNQRVATHQENCANRFEESGMA